jgi:hypothetical protein
MTSRETPAGTFEGPGLVIQDGETGEVIYEADPVPDDYEGDTMTVTWDENGLFKLS